MGKRCNGGESPTVSIVIQITATGCDAIRACAEGYRHTSPTPVADRALRETVGVQAGAVAP